MTPTHAPPANIPQQTCTTCRWHKYLVTFDEHLCKYEIPGIGQVGIIDNTDRPCEAYEPQEAGE